MTIQKGKGHLFDGYVFALVLGTSDYDTKKILRQKITSNGGTVSYLVTQKCHFVVRCPSVSDASDWGLRTARKYAIPTVAPSFVDTCLTENKVLTPTACQTEVEDQTVHRLERDFQKGHVREKDPDTPSDVKRTSTTKSLKVWEYGDVNGPRFHDHPHKVAKFTVLKGERRLKGDIPMCVLEIQVSDALDPAQTGTLPKYCVFVEVGTIREDRQGEYDPGPKASSRTCRYTDDREVALRTYAHQHKTYTSPPHSYSEWGRHWPVPSFVGSAEFRKIREWWTSSGHVADERVRALVNLVWTEAEDHLGRTIDRSIEELHCKEVDQAESLLLQMLDASNAATKDEEIRDLSNRYLDIVHPKEKPDLSLPEVIVEQRRLLQAVRDVAAVGEALRRDGGERPPTRVRYEALGCGIRPLEDSSEEFATIKERFLSSWKDDSKKPTIKNIFAVRRSTEEESFTKHVDHQEVLFHGSEVRHFVGILSRGLLMEEADGGSATSLGKAIYFSDSASKSAEFSSAGKTQGTRLLSVALVALGRCYPTTNRRPELTSPPEGYDSVWGQPSAHSETSDFQESEFAIYDVRRQKQTHLVEFALPGDVASTPVTEPTSDGDVPRLASGDNATPVAPALRVSDVLNELTFLPEERPVQCGFRSAVPASIVPKSVHVRARLVDLAAQVVILQEYRNESGSTVEARYVFPLDEMAAVCAFEAYIDGKHVVGEIDERQRAHHRYREAIQEGHGAYLMDEDGPDVFSVSVGNLPVRATVVIKITYVAELTTDEEKIRFRLPGSLVSQQKNLSAESRNVELEVAPPKSPDDVSIHVGIEMPFDIRKISSPTHKILVKKTDTMATVRLDAGQTVTDCFELLVDLAEIHVPRMWVEKGDGEDDEACMLTFYPSFGDEAYESGTLIVLLDASHSMKGDSWAMAQKVALLSLRLLPPDWKFNVVLFGFAFRELFVMPQPKSPENVASAEDFILRASADLGSTEPLAALEPLFLLGPVEGDDVQNVFLISDGQMTHVGPLLRRADRHAPSTRIFTFGVGQKRCPCHSHVLRVLARRSAGAFEEFDAGRKSQWEVQIRRQVRRASRPVLTDIGIEWQQLDRDAPTPVQAPAKIPSLFHGERRVVYGFVPRCTMATLTARVGCRQLSTVVSTSELSKTEGKVLHRLTARAILQDWSDGILEDDGVLREAKKLQWTPYVVALSKRHGVLCSLTSYVAVERREKGASRSVKGPSICELADAEDVDRLPYLTFPEEDERRGKAAGPPPPPPIMGIGMEVPSNLPKKHKKKKKAVTVEDSLADGFTFGEEREGSFEAMDYEDSVVGNAIDIQSPSTALEATQFFLVARDVEEEEDDDDDDMGFGLFDDGHDAPIAKTRGGFLRHRKCLPMEDEERLNIASVSSKELKRPLGLRKDPDVLFRTAGLEKQSTSTALTANAPRFFRGNPVIGGGFSSHGRFPTPTSVVPMSATTSFLFGESGTCLAANGEAPATSFGCSRSYGSPITVGENDATTSFGKSAVTTSSGRSAATSFGFARRYASPVTFDGDAVTTLFGGSAVTTLSGRNYASPVTVGGNPKRRARSAKTAMMFPMSEDPLVGMCAPTELGSTVRLFTNNPEIKRKIAQLSTTRLSIAPLPDALTTPATSSSNEDIPAKMTTTKGGLPACSALIDQLVASYRDPTVNEIKTLLKQGPGPRHNSLFDWQEKLSDLLQASKAPSVKNFAMSHILPFQARDGCFPMMTMGSWANATIAERITELLDDRGLRSIGLARVQVLNMCATLMAAFTLCKMATNEYPDLTADSSWSAFVSFTWSEPQLFIALLKALAYVRWVYERQPLLYAALRLNSIPEAGSTWESFALHFVKQVQSTSSQ